MHKRIHKNDPDAFCYVCAEFIGRTKRNLTPTLQEAFWKCFQTSCADILRPFTPSYICSGCHRNLYRYHRNNKVKLPFKCPAIWTECSSHDYRCCYFCSIKKHSLKRKPKYFDCASCTIPKLCLPDLDDRPDATSTASNSQSPTDQSETDFVDEGASTGHFNWSLESFNDFCRELRLSKLLSMKCLGMLKEDPDLKKKLSAVTVRQVKQRSQDVIDMFSKSGDFTYCNDIERLMAFLCVPYDSSDWCLFVDSSTTSLKAALMYKSNLHPTIPIAYANVQENRSSIKEILRLIQYESHGWLIMCDLKVLNFMMGLKSGYAKYPCFYCMFDSRQSQIDFNPSHTWPVRVDFDIDPLVPIDKIAFPFLHIKLGIFQKYVKALDKESECFKFICKNIKKSKAKLLNGVLTGPEIRYLMKNDDFPKTMTDLERSAWFNFIAVATNVLGKHVTEEWKEKVDQLIFSFQAMGCPTVSSKMHLLFKHKDKYEPYIGIFSDEHGERLHKEMQVIEKRFKQCLNKEMLAECIWSLKRSTTLFKSSRNVY